MVGPLRSASALEMYRRTARPHLSRNKVIDFLLLDRCFPRSVRYCVGGAEDSLHAITGTPEGTFGNRPSSNSAASDLSSTLPRSTTSFPRPARIHRRRAGPAEPHRRSRLPELSPARLRRRPVSNAGTVPIIAAVPALHAIQQLTPALYRFRLTSTYSRGVSIPPNRSRHARPLRSVSRSG